MKIPHLNVNGYAGVGKSTVLLILAQKYRTIWIPRITTRPMRKGENINEYEFVSWEEFRQRLLGSLARGNDVYIADGEITFSGDPDPDQFQGEVAGDILTRSAHQVFVRKGSYWTGVPHPRTWPTSFPDTELIISTFGYFSPIVKENYAQDMINIFIDVHDEEELRRRLKERSRKLDLNFSEQWRKNLDKMEEMRKGGYKKYRVVYNDDSPEDCAAEISRIVEEARLCLAG